MRANSQKGARAWSEVASPERSVMSVVSGMIYSSD